MFMGPPPPPEKKPPPSSEEASKPQSLLERLACITVEPTDLVELGDPKKTNIERWKGHFSAAHMAYQDTLDALLRLRQRLLDEKRPCGHHDIYLKIIAEVLGDCMKPPMPLTEMPASTIEDVMERDRKSEPKKDDTDHLPPR